MKCGTFSIHSVYVRYTVLEVFVEFCVEVIRFHTFRATLPINLEIVVRFYTVRLRSVYIPEKVTRFYTFVQPLSKFKILIRFHTFHIHSVHTPRFFFKLLFKFYTFLYIPCNPFAQIANSYPPTLLCRGMGVIDYFCSSKIKCMLCWWTPSKIHRTWRRT